MLKIKMAMMDFLFMGMDFDSSFWFLACFGLFVHKL